MSEVRKWLETIALSQYADAFETNDLEIDLLQQIDDQLLKDIGVSSAGHRLRMTSIVVVIFSDPTLRKSRARCFWFAFYISCCSAARPSGGRMRMMLPFTRLTC